MKKLYYLFLLPMFVMMACGKDDFQPVDMTLTLSGVTETNEVFYTVGGEEITINNLKVEAVGGKTTTFQNVAFYLNNVLLVGDWSDPFTVSFPTENLPSGTYHLGVTGNLLQVDASIQTFVVSYPLVIVDNVEDLPDDAPDFGTYSMTVRIQSQEK